MESCKQEWWLYLVRCNDNSLYTGIALDVEKRFLQHQQDTKKSAKYFSGRRPLTLVARRAIGGKALALKVEREVKRLKKSRKENLVKDIRLLDEVIENVKTGWTRS